VNWRGHSGCGVSPLDNAAFVGNLDIVRVLLEAGADVNSSDNCGLFWAINRAREDMAMSKGHHGVARMIAQALFSVANESPFFVSVKNKN